MNRTLLLSLVVPVLFLMLVPVMAHADASVVQDSCVVVGDGPPWLEVWTYFTVVNFSLPVAVCDLHFIPEPQPSLPGCTFIEIKSPSGWSGFLNPFGGADWFANAPGDCIEPGTAKGEFAFKLDPDFCCYVVQFTDATGAVILEQEECFTCQKVPVNEKTWGHIKELYE